MSNWPAYQWGKLEENLTSTHVGCSHILRYMSTDSTAWLVSFVKYRAVVVHWGAAAMQQLNNHLSVETNIAIQPYEASYMQW